jgi:hypothetical protein
MGKLKEISWSYTHPEYGKLHDSVQKDWNQTLCTVLNQIGAAYMHTDRNADMIIPNKFEGLFRSIVYYNQYADRYRIIYIGSDVNYVMVGKCKLNIENFPNE